MRAPIGRLRPYAIAAAALCCVLAATTFAHAEKAQLQLIKGFQFPLVTRDNREYEDGLVAAGFTQDANDSHHYQTDTIDAYVYAYNDSARVLQDAAAHPNASREVWAYSAGSPIIQTLDDAGYHIGLAVLVDGTTGFGSSNSVALTLHNTSQLVNFVSQDVGLHGTLDQTVTNGAYIGIELPRSIAHPDALAFVAVGRKFLDWGIRKASDLSAGGMTNSGSWGTGAGRGGGGGGGFGGGVGGAGGGGGDSHPPWLRHHVKPRSPDGPPDRLRALFIAIDRLFHMDIGAPSAEADLQPSDELASFVPTIGPEGQAGLPESPDVLGISDALSATGMNYTDAAGRVTSAIFAAETLNEPYEHDFEVCRRVNNFELRGADPIRYAGAWWWTLRTAKSRLGYDEVALPVTVTLNGPEARVDSRYLVEDFPGGIAGRVFNYQIWATDLPRALFLLDQILSAIGASHSVVFANANEPPLAQVLARTATYRHPNVHLALENRGAETDVHFFGPTWREPRHRAEHTVDFTRSVPSGESELDLPVGTVHDAVIYIDAAGFLDKIYVASGTWFAFDDSAGGGTSQPHLTTGELQHPPISGTAAWFASPPRAELTGRVTALLPWSFIGIGYTFQQGEEPLDLSGEQGIAFWAEGDGATYRVKLESLAVTDNDYHGAFFTAPPGGALITIPFTELQQEGWGHPVSWTGRDIVRVSFVTTTRPRATVELAIDGIGFLSHPTVSTSTLASATTTTTTAPGNTSTTLSTAQCISTCDDGDPCTVDQCFSGTCLHEDIGELGDAACVCARAMPEACRGQVVPAKLSRVRARACDVIRRATRARRAAKRVRASKRAARLWLRAGRLLDRKAAKHSLTVDCREVLRGALRDAWARADRLAR